MAEDAGTSIGGLADVSVLPRALTATEIQKTAEEKHPVSAGKTFNGKTDFEDQPAPAVKNELTVSAWIRIEGLGGANYIVSKGEWSTAYSLGLSNGCLRWAIGHRFVQSEKPLALHKWIHVAGVFDGRELSAYVDGAGVARSDGVLGAAIDHDKWIASASRRLDTTPGCREVTIASRFIGPTPSINAYGDMRVTLAPGSTVTVAVAILSDLDAKDHEVAAQKRVSGLSNAEIARLAARHKEWWSQYWARSFIEIPDKVIEQHWYAALYILGSCSRAGKVAPGLWGNWVTTDSPMWNGDYHLNYNFEAPFCMFYSSNHADLALPYYQVMVDALPKGREQAKRRGWKGIEFSTGIGPWGSSIFTEDFGQRSNALLAATNFLAGYKYTRDLDFLRKTAYPFLLEVAAFWEDYLKFEDGRYVDYNDSIHEGSGPDFNPIMSLGLLRPFFESLVAMSEDPGVSMPNVAPSGATSSIISAPFQHSN